MTDLALVQLSALTNLTSFRRLRLSDHECECWDDSVQHLALSHSQVSQSVKVGKLNPNRVAHVVAATV